MMTKLLAAIAAALALTGAASGSAAQQQPLLGLVWRDDVAHLAPLHATTLRPLGRTLALGRFGNGWSFSADRSKLALGSTWEPNVARPPAIRIVDTMKLTSLGVVALPRELLPVRATAWAGTRLLAVVGRAGGYRVVAVDTQRFRVIAKRLLARTIVAGSVVPGGLALLTAPIDDIGVARVIFVDKSLSFRTIALARIRAGTKATSENGNDVRVRLQQPAFAVTPDGVRAFVLGDGPLAVVDLRSGEVRYEQVRATATAAKLVEGWTRRATWLDAGRLLVTGSDYSYSGNQVQQTPIGAHLVDTRSLTRTTLDEQAAFAVPAAGLVLTWSTIGARPGLRALTPDGSQRYEALSDQWIGQVQFAGNVALAVVSGLAPRTEVVDLATGRTTATIPGYPPPEPLLGSARPAW
jgi:hypothetical protein